MDKTRIRDGKNSEPGSGINIPVPQHCLQDSVGLGFYLRDNVAHLGGTVARGVAVSPEPDELRHARQNCELVLLPRCLSLGQDAVAGIRIIHRRGIHLTGATGKKKNVLERILTLPSVLNNFCPSN
jgi:hypothetical protein